MKVVIVSGTDDQIGNSATHARLSALNALSRQISECRRCDDSGISVRHGGPLERGQGSRVLVIGIEPGGSEIAQSQAFVGPGGSKKWGQITVSAYIRENCDLSRP